MPFRLCHSGPVLFASALFVLVAGCSSASTQAANADSPDATANGGSDNSAGQSGSSTGGASGAAGSAGARTAGGVAGSTGGSRSSGGASGTGAGGTPATGGQPASGGATGGCASASDCHVGVERCLPPHQQDPNAGACGAIPWCGRCQCPSVMAAVGAGFACDANVKCPAAGSAPHVASTCVQGQCTECQTDLDCAGTATPICGLLPALGSQLHPSCVECRTDHDCHGKKARCATYSSPANPKPLAGECVECLGTGDCATGVCTTDNTCVAECGTDADCGDPLQACTADKRCARKPCAGAGGCPTYSTCTDGYCISKACASDTDCSGGHCVNGGCFDALGRCVPAYGPP